MVKQFMSILAFLMSLVLQAQVTVTVQLPQAGMVRKDQLWNLVLINSSPAAVETSILLNLRDAVTGQPVLSAGTRSFLLSKGVKLLNVQEIQPVQYNMGAAGFSGEYLPIGSYNACYTISTSMYERLEPVANECVRLDIAPLNPLLLSTPADKSVLQSTAPQLTWIPPTPLAMFDNLNYELSLVEVQQGQVPADAIRYNTPVYAKANFRVPYENYPSSYSKLGDGKTYAWQVIARNGLTYVTASDIWTFTMAKDSVNVKETGFSFIMLKTNREASNVNYISGEKLYIKYYSFDREHENVIRFFDSKGRLLQQISRQIAYGDNFLSFELNSKFRKGAIYHIEITDLKSQKYTSSFSLN
ncbi:hypothetical protein V9K67_24430 [Paraflavisolibacter sp. H34]|uniref:hypothetical protein n=1 Tax=Huijunlia imazamoxiresistens TaxID=3127457 RepID=UPI00301A11A8